MVAGHRARVPMSTPGLAGVQASPQPFCSVDNGNEDGRTELGPLAQPPVILLPVSVSAGEAAPLRVVTIGRPPSPGTKTKVNVQHRWRW